MKLPEPAVTLHSDGYWMADMDTEAGRMVNAQVSFVGAPKLGMYSGAQVKELLAQADKDFSDGMTVVHLQVADQMRRKYEPVLKMALTDLVEIDKARLYPVGDALTAIRKVLG